MSVRIRRVRIQGYRCLRDVDIRFDDITTFIGPNGVGKSAVLRALDWFFNGTSGAGLTDEDVWAAAQEKRISVEVEFSDLTDLDRTALGKYAAGGAETVRLWRRWENDTDKLSGRAMGYPAFDDVREPDRAGERNARYKALREARPELGLPTARSSQAVEEAMAEWERKHPDELVATELAADTHFFGFAGQAKMTGLFDYVFVSADLRAGEEGRDSKGSIIGRILDQAVDRTQAEKDLLDLQTLFNSDRQEIHRQHFEEQLDTLSGQLTDEVEKLSSGRRVRVSSHVPELRLPQAQFQISVQDGTASTRLDQQGHGFQRALLITALRLLAESKSSENRRTVFLAIEEPELFQHPVQARVFAAVLRALAGDVDRGMQIAYATHSPYFLEPEGFTEIRRLTRAIQGGAPTVLVDSTTQGEITTRLDGILPANKIHRQLMKVCLREIPEALFARAVILVEGPTDKGVLEGCGLRLDPLNKHGIVVVDVVGKSKIPLAHAILTELGVPTMAVFDGDARHAERNTGATKEKIDKGTEWHKSENRKLLAYLGGTLADFPTTHMGKGYAVFHDSLETYLEEEWPEWATAKKQLIADGDGVDGKHEDTYRQAAVEAEAAPPVWLSQILIQALALAADS
ncbi:AAA family ATPase [Streptosporangium canum]|uniref:ATP-dependent nuclease n=1 Tax=Streptosporangium canum TaxID=324952 RepID=UPI003427DF4C